MTTLVACSRAERPTLFVVLPSGEARSIFATDGLWQPTSSEVDAAESHISQITGLEHQVAGSRFHIDHPERYYRQYVPVRLDGKKLLLLNAICKEQLPSDWRSRLVDVLDGGDCYWKAFYDPNTGRFSHLTINGQG